MVRAALAWNGRIGIAMMRPGWEQCYADPPIYCHGGLGSIVHVEPLNASGELSIRVQGLERFCIRRCLRRRPVIEAEVEYPGSENGLRQEELPLEELVQLAARLQRQQEGSVQLELGGLSFGKPGPFIDRLAVSIRLRPCQKQQILEAALVAQRFGKLCGLLRASLFDIELMKALKATPPGVMHAN